MELTIVAGILVAAAWAITAKRHGTVSLRAILMRIVLEALAFFASTGKLSGLLGALSYS